MTDLSEYGYLEIQHPDADDGVHQQLPVIEHPGYGIGQLRLCQARRMYVTQYREGDVSFRADEVARSLIAATRQRGSRDVFPVRYIEGGRRVLVQTADLDAEDIVALDQGLGQSVGRPDGAVALFSEVDRLFRVDAGRKSPAKATKQY